MAPTRRQRQLKEAGDGNVGGGGGFGGENASTWSQFRVGSAKNAWNEWKVRIHMTQAVSQCMCVCVYVCVYVQHYVWVCLCGANKLQGKRMNWSCVAVTEKLTSKCIKQKLSTIFQSDPPCACLSVSTPLGLSLSHALRRPWTIASPTRRRRVCLNKQSVVWGIVGALSGGESQKKSVSQQQLLQGGGEYVRRLEMCACCLFELV